MIHQSTHQIHRTLLNIYHIMLTEFYVILHLAYLENDSVQNFSSASCTRI